MQYLRRGQLAVSVLFFAALAVVLITGLVFLASSFLNLSVRTLYRGQAFAIAEAGVEYYRWHLAHAPTDFWDGAGASSTGPYIHPYYDKTGTEIGQFELTITPPPAGSTVVTVRSAGKVAADSSIQKIIEVKLAIASFAKYAWAEGASDSFGTAAEVFGPMHTNGGFHFDGVAHNLITSALTNYTHDSKNAWGVHTTNGVDDPAYPTALPSRPDVFMGGRQVGVPALNFSQLTQDLAEIKDAASSTGTYFPSSTAKGYELVFATSGMYSVYRVNTTSTRGSCNYERWTITSSTLIATGTIPNNGNLFFEDNLWVRGQIDGKRVTVGAAKFPDIASERKNITVNNDILYSHYDCSETIALIAQNNINVGYSSENDLRIDAALVAQNGSVGRDSYSTSLCGSSSTRSSLVMYGSFSNLLVRPFSTYSSRTYIYDANLLYCPPPSFPLTGDQYTPISWNEIQ